MPEASSSIQIYQIDNPLAAIVGNEITPCNDPNSTPANKTATYSTDQLKNYISQYLICTAADVVGIPGTYDNGTAGVGATLTISTITLPWVINGYPMQVGDTFLLGYQSQGTTPANNIQNGLYDITTLETGNIVLTRSTNFDNSLTGIIQYGITILPVHGTTEPTDPQGCPMFALKSQYFTSSPPIVLGITQLNFFMVRPSGVWLNQDLSIYLATNPSEALLFLNTILPGQGGNSGKYLSTDGDNPNWQSAPAATVPISTPQTALIPNIGFAILNSGDQTLLAANATRTIKVLDVELTINTAVTGANLYCGYGPSVLLNYSAASLVVGPVRGCQNTTPNTGWNSTITNTRIFLDTDGTLLTGNVDARITWEYTS